MKAIGLTRYLPISNPESLVDIELDKPTPTGRDLHVKVEAIAVNPVDTKVRAPTRTKWKRSRACSAGTRRAWSKRSGRT